MDRPMTTTSANRDTDVQTRQVVTVRDLTKRYGDVVAVHKLSFSLDAGTITGFLGPNGAGKTTMLRLLLGLARPSSGEALVFGRSYRELNHPSRRVGPGLGAGELHPGPRGAAHPPRVALAGVTGRDP